MENDPAMDTQQECIIQKYGDVEVPHGNIDLLKIDKNPFAGGPRGCRLKTVAKQMYTSARRIPSLHF